MTDDDRTLERAARSWLEIGPDQAPPGAVEAALLRIQTTPQERDLRILRRFTQMSMPIRVATAAAIGVLVVGGAFYVFGRPQQNVGAPGPSPSASPTASAALPSTPAPNRTSGAWQATLDTPLNGVPGASGAIQLWIDWPDSAGSWIQTEAGDQILMGDSVAAPAGEIDLVASDGSVGCQKGDLGRYSWSRSSDGLFLTLTVVEDACAARAEAYSRTWVHSLNVVNDGGLGVFPGPGSWAEVTLPSVRWALDDTSLHTFDAGDPARSFLVMQDPEGYDQPCSAGGRAAVPQAAIGGATAVTAYADYLRAQPGFDATVTDTQVDGRQAVHVALSPKASFECPSGNYALFHDGFERDIEPGQAHSFWIVDVGAHTAIVRYDGEGVTPADGQAVISSIKFLGDTLPTP